MSYLELNRPLNRRAPNLGGFNIGKVLGKFADPFGLQARQERGAAKDAGKLAIQQEAQTFEQKLVLEKDKRQVERTDELRALIVQKVRVIENESVQISVTLDKIRRAAAVPELAGDPILADLDEKLGDLEVTIVQVQSGTVVDTATYDTNALAVSHADAQAAILALQAVRTRAQGIYDGLEARVKAIRAEEIRVERARQEREEQLRLAAQRAEQQRAMEEERRAREAEEAERVQRLSLMQRSMELDRMIAEEKRALRRAKSDLAQLLSA